MPDGWKFVAGEKSQNHKVYIQFMLTTVSGNYPDVVNEQSGELSRTKQNASHQTKGSCLAT